MARVCSLWGWRAPVSLESHTLPLSTVTLFPKPKPRPTARFYSVWFVNVCVKLYKVREVESQ